jgi:hypothetical protein
MRPGAPTAPANWPDAVRSGRPIGNTQLPLAGLITGLSITSARRPVAARTCANGPSPATFIGGISPGGSADTART